MRHSASNRLKTILIIALLLVSLPVVANGPNFSATVERVLDGDTIDVLHDGHLERIRLNGIDAPEKGQPYGRRAKQFLSDLVAGKTVTVHSLKIDKHRRTVADVMLPEGSTVNKELVRAGFAWWYRQYSKDTAIEQLEREARNAKRGLWAEPSPVPPWVYRHPKLANGKALHDEPETHSIGKLPRMGELIKGLIIGNKNSHVYHRPDCPSYTATTPKNRVIFENEAAAEKAGYRRALNCP